MAFLRIKRIKGQEYAYLVENTWKRNKSSQKVLKYLGRVDRIPARKVPVLAVPEGLDYNSLLKEILRQTYHAHGIPEEAIEKGKAYALDHGILCREMIQRLRRFKIKNNESQRDVAVRLARYLVEAGLDVPQKVYVQLYEKIVPITLE